MSWWGATLLPVLLGMLIHAKHRRPGEHCRVSERWATGETARDGLTVEFERQRSYNRSAIGGDRFAVPREDYAESPTLDALLVRALLLDAICRGNLEPRQVEIVDSWLWEWSGDYTFTDTDAGAVVAIDSGRPRGLRPAGHENRRRRYVRIDTLEGQIKLVVDGFRAGDIFPGYGLATEFRVEEHAAALDFLRRFLDSARYRRSRESRAGREQKLEALVGLAEIMPKAFSPRTSPLAPAKPGQEPAAHHGQQLTGLDTLFEIPRRYVRVLDESADGVGVEYEDDPTRRVSVGTVIMLHHDDSSPPLLCEVMRRFIPSGGKARLGLRILSRSPKKLKLWRPVANPAAWARSTCPATTPPARSTRCSSPRATSTSTRTSRRASTTACSCCA